MLPLLLIVGVFVGIYLLRRTRRPTKDLGPETSSQPDQAPKQPLVAAENRGDYTSAAAADHDGPQVGRGELVEMIDALIEQYEDEIREMTPAQQNKRKGSWEEFEQREAMSQMDFSEGVIERFWGYAPGSTPEIPNTKKLRLARGVWYTNRQLPPEA